jgi:hypothetical protein
MRRIEDIALIIFFLAALALPVVGLALGFDPGRAHKENRVLAPFPPVSLKRHVLGSFPEKFRAYFEDHFGFRNMLIEWQAKVKVKWLGVSSSKRVILGKDGWLFQPPYDNSLEWYRGPRPLTVAELAQWQRVLKARRDWLAERGIRYIFVIAPEKHTIYPEYVPEAFRRMQEVSRLEQLVRYMKEHSDVEILDLRQPLMEAKGRERLYHRTDSHWNEYGAFIGYQAIAAELMKASAQIQPLAESDFELVREQKKEMDLAAQLGLDDVLSEENLRMRPRRASLEFRLNPDIKYVVSDGKETRLPRVVMFRDSFANNLIPFLDHHFSRAVYVWNYGLDTALIETERPQFVIQEVVERYLLNAPPQNPLVLQE